MNNFKGAHIFNSVYSQLTDKLGFYTFTNTERRKTKKVDRGLVEEGWGYLWGQIQKTRHHGAVSF
jgi:hypothetical protein